MTNQRFALYAAGVLIALASGVSRAGDLTANAAVTNNYIWRGLTQTENGAAVSGGLDYAAENGFYIGTWVSNVSFAPGDAFSYENDIYFGYSGGDKVKYDVGYLYYNYDDLADTDFGEIYGKLNVGGFGASLYALANTQLEEGPGQDFGFGQALYFSIDYSLGLKNDVSLGLHAGRYSGDFNEAFNVVPDDYTDYNISLSKGGFTFMVSDTDLDSKVPDGLDNGSVKFVVSYKVDIDL
ncbi:MAG TPA: TorF family putative porin [Gammaproteobacteria bacterium]|nr:TorF family putative porin [Gammaproteobacteria bacterium]